jgi:hypothetical protein
MLSEPFIYLHYTCNTNTCYFSRILLILPNELSDVMSFNALQCDFDELVLSERHLRLGIGCLETGCVRTEHVTKRDSLFRFM